jgi:hypothetical protein
MTNTECTIPSIVLHEAPFNLPWASSIYVKVLATNIYGSSEQSDAGNGGIIYALPDKPVNLQENLSERTYTTLGFSWQDGADPGGLPVLDYKVTITDTTNTYNVIAEYLTSASYTALSLTVGETYTFKVQSRNSHGYSDFSDELSLLCAVKPGVPSDVLSTNSGSNVVLTWTAPDSNGSPLTSYTV